MRKNTVFRNSKLFMKIKAFFEREKYIWDNNAVEIHDINNKMICLLMKMLCIGAFVLSLIVTYQEALYPLRVLYYMLLLCSLGLWLMIRLNKEKIDSLFFLYLIHIMMFLFALYGARVVMPDSRSTLIIGFIFVCPLTVFDKMIRVNVVMLLFLINYIGLVTPVKVDGVAFLDAITVIGFSIVSMILGSYLRQLQLDNIDLRRQSRLREATDALTGLLSRANLLKIEETHHVVDKIAAVIMIDIDYFKAYNDTYGHQQGDACLKSVSDVFLDMSHQHSISFFRYGGEEFLGIVWDHEEDVIEICQALVTRIRSMHTIHDRSPFKYVTLSVGCSLVEEGEQKSFEQLIAEADKALYQSKDAGRNQVTIYQHIAK